MHNDHNQIQFAKILAFYLLYTKKYNNCYKLYFQIAALLQQENTIESIKQSEKYFIKSLSLNDQSATVHLNYAIFLEMKSAVYNCDKAIYHYKKALSIEPTNGKNWYHLGVCLVNVRQYEQALPYLTKAMTLAPDFHLEINYFAQGKALCHLRKYNQATRMFKKALDNDKVSNKLSNVQIQEANKWIKEMEDKIGIIGDNDNDHEDDHDDNDRFAINCDWKAKYLALEAKYNELENELVQLKSTQVWYSVM